MAWLPPWPGHRLLALVAQWQSTRIPSGGWTFESFPALRYAAVRGGDARVFLAIVYFVALTGAVVVIALIAVAVVAAVISSEDDGWDR